MALLAYGPAARREAAACIGSLRTYHPGLPITVLSDAPLGIAGVDNPTRSPLGAIDKLRVLDWTRCERVLYLDADTRAGGNLLAGFGLLEHYDLAITASNNQARDWLWHASLAEREATLAAMGFQGLQLQGGLWFLRRTEETMAFMAAWQREWVTYRGPDQGALLRALYARPIRVWLLGRPWNGGALVEHRFGSARMAL